ncbi:MAG: ABC transporter permease [Desulfobacteraceae bacterium IS3]|nr:MAG: ABC transporter permease [Desulfobacteraceae bacterium IS3]
MSFELFISRRYLRSKQRHTFISLITWLSVAGVTVGVMALIVVIAVMAGFESDLKSRILGVESHIVLMRYGSEFTEYREVLDYLKSVQGIEAATPFIYSQTMLRSGAGLSGAVLRGIDPASAGKVIKNLDGAALQTSEKAGSKDETVKVPGIILGKELAKTLGVGEGDMIYVISPRGMVSPVGHLPAMKRFSVVALFESGMYEYDGSLAYIRLDEAQRLLHTEDAVTGIEIRLKHIDEAKKIAEKIVNGLALKYRQRYWARDWMQMNRNLFSALQLEKTVMFIILALIVLVAAFNIASSLIMMVMEKTRDIAILKAMGATDKSIRKIFIFKGMFIGLLGTTFGVMLGSLLCFLLKKYQFIKLPPDVYYITNLPVQLEFLDVFIIAVSAMVICFLSTLYPARQASKLNPVEAFRY